MKTPPTSINPPPSDRDPAYDLVLVVQRIGFDDFPEQFTGVAYVSHTELDLYVKNTDTGVILNVVEAIPHDGVTINIHRVPHSHAELRDIQQLVISEIDRLREEGVILCSMGPDIKTGTLHIALQPPTDDVLRTIARRHGTPSAVESDYIDESRRILNARYGEDIITVEPETRPPGTLLPLIDQSVNAAPRD